MSTVLKRRLPYIHKHTVATDCNHNVSLNWRKVQQVSGLDYSPRNKNENERQKTYNSGDSLVVTDPTTNPPVSGLTMGERTGSRIFHYLWSYVLERVVVLNYIDGQFPLLLSLPTTPPR